MSNSKQMRRSSSSNQSINSSTTRKTTVFPLPNATKPRHRVTKKIELNELPDDVLLYIFRLLSPIDLLNIGIICRRW
jgi:F-box associated protein